MFSDLPLHKALLRSLEGLGLVEPTPVQLALVPAAMEGADLRVTAETGSGKTLAFLLPLFQRLLSRPAEGDGVRALVLLPTRELARQVHTEASALARHTNLRGEVIFGADHFGGQMERLEPAPELLVATPGRLLKHLKLGTVDLSSIEVLVLDEADRMLEMGFSEEVLGIADHCSVTRQTLMLSATLGRKGLNGLARELMDEPQIITLSPIRAQHRDIRQQILLSDDIPHKLSQTLWLLRNEAFAKALVFTNTRDRADQVGSFLMGAGVRLGVLHGDLDQSSRNRVMAWLREGVITVLVATDIASRGLDVEGIDLVINLDMARRGDLHLHRTGRTGRAGRKGLAISLVSPTEWNLMAGIERYLRLRFERRVIGELKGNYSGPKRLKRSGKAAPRPRCGSPETGASVSGRSGATSGSCRTGN
ncbi:MAG: DEAD/DEAH box helicase [Candidatus Sedimenticola endophacoides]